LSATTLPLPVGFFMPDILPDRVARPVCAQHTGKARA
jgi:hypothetical protein